MKRFVCAILVCWLTLAVLTPASAADFDEAILGRIEQMLFDGFAAGETVIDTSVDGLSGNAYFAYGQEALDRIVMKHPEYDDQIVTKCRMVIRRPGDYRMEVTYHPDAAARRASLAAEIERILDGIDPAWNEIQRLLYLHDYVVLHYQYDTTYAADSVYLMIERGVGICESYSSLIKLCLDRMGFENDFATTSDHRWNIVRLSDGAWYHLDATWDDPLPDRIGQAEHQYFLVSDTVRGVDPQGAAYPFSSPVACTSTRYDKAGWRQTFAPLAEIDGQWYLLTRRNNRTLMRYDFATDTMTSTGVTLPMWTLRNDLYSAYSSGYSGLFAHGGLLYFNTPTAICTYDPATGARATYRTPDTSRGYLCGIAKLDGRLTYGLRNDPYDTDYVALATVDLPKPAEPKPVEPAPVEPKPTEPEPTLQPGTPIGNVLYTDILAYIDGHAICSYNIDGYTYVVAEDLLDYGFAVRWLPEQKRLAVSTTRTATPAGYSAAYVPSPNTHPAGAVAMQYLYTEITVWLGERQVKSYNIGGFTCICMDDLAEVFGTAYVWDPSSPALRLTTQP